MPITDTVGTYTTENALGYPGMIAEGQAIKDVASRVVETAAVAFGLAVGKGTADESCKLGGTGFEGITVADKAQEADQYAVGDMAGVIRKGTVWVTASVSVVPGDAVYFVAATGEITNVATANVAIPNGSFETTATAGNLVRLHLA